MSSEGELLGQLAKEVDELGQRMHLVGVRLRGLEHRAMTEPAAPIVAPAPLPPRAPEPATSTPTTREPVPPQRTPPRPVLMPPAPPVRIEQPATLASTLGRRGAGSRILGWLGGAVTLVGIILLLVLAVQRGWLGPQARVLLGAALGLVLIGAGLRVHPKPGGRTGALALVATGTATLYLDTIAATTIYRYLPELAGLAAGLAIAAGGLVLASRWRAPLLGTAMVVGCAIFAPFITRGFPPELVAFLLVLQIAAVPLDNRPGWSPVTLAAGVPPLLASLIGSFAVPHPATVPNTVAAAGAGLVGIVVTLVSARRRERDPMALGLLVAAAAPTLVAASLLTRTPAALVAAGVAVVLAGVAAGRRWWPGPAADIAAGVALVATLQATVTAFDGTARAVVLLGEAVVLLLLALRAQHRVALFGAIALGSVGALLALSGDASLVPVVMYRTRGAGQLSAAAAEAVLIVVNAIAVPWVAYRFRLLRSAAENLGPWLAAGAVALYGAATGILAAAELVVPGRAGFFLGHVLVTVSWTATALVLLVRGVDAVLPRVVGLVLVGAAVLKLVTFDLSELDGIARVTVFLGAGLILLFAGTRYARLVRVRQPGDDDPAPRPDPYAVGDPVRSDLE